jgi:hypothetical protein
MKKWFGSGNRFRTQGLLVNSLIPLSISLPGKPCPEHHRFPLPPIAEQN